MSAYFGFSAQKYHCVPDWDYVEYVVFFMSWAPVCAFC